jgi:PTS system nitrogen regulatory IIA component
MLDSILDALQEGRLIELPDNEKTDALQVLSHLIEAIPSVPAQTDVAGSILNREKASITSLGMGWACPHARVEFDGDLLCAIGWSPQGIDYGIAGEPLVRVVVMYLVPQNQRNQYLKEVSQLVKVVKDRPEYQHLETIQDLNDVRNRLLDMAELTIEGFKPDSRARMIQLEARTGAAPPAEALLKGITIEPLTIIVRPDSKPVILTQNRELLDVAQSDPGLAGAITEVGRHELRGWRIFRRSTAHYQGGQVMYDCLAIGAGEAAR